MYYCTITNNLQFYPMDNRKKVLFVCTGNSCRSQIAEGLLKHIANEQFEVYSAGSHPSRIHPCAIQVMEEKNIDISSQTSNHIDDYLDNNIDIVITVCDNAKKVCPVFPGNANRIHWSIDDPFKGWDFNQTHLNNFRKTLEDIENRIYKFLNKARQI